MPSRFLTLTDGRLPDLPGQNLPSSGAAPHTGNHDPAPGHDLAPPPRGQSWFDAWTGTAADLAARGEEALQRGHLYTASWAYLAAAECYAKALVFADGLDALHFVPLCLNFTLRHPGRQS